MRANGQMLFPEKKNDKDSDSSARSSPTDDYDYVNLESKAKFDEDNEEVKRSLPHDLKRGFDVLVAQSGDLPVLPAAHEKVCYRSHRLQKEVTRECHLSNSLHLD